MSTKRIFVIAASTLAIWVSTSVMADQTPPSQQNLDKMQTCINKVTARTSTQQQNAQQQKLTPRQTALVNKCIKSAGIQGTTSIIYNEDTSQVSNTPAAKGRSFDDAVGGTSVVAPTSSDNNFNTPLSQLR